jgi:hypothetical protein
VTTILLPSAPALFIARAKTHPDLAAIQSTRVGTKLNATLPCTRVQRIGGSPVDPWEDQPLLQVEAWAVDEGTADLLIRTWVAALDDFRYRGDPHIHRRVRALLGAGRPHPVEQLPLHHHHSPDHHPIGRHRDNPTR